MSERRSVDIARFNEIDDSWVQTGGLWTRCIFIGKAKSPDSPVGIAIKADPEIGDRVAGRRSFGTTTMLVVLSAPSCTMTGGFRRGTSTSPRRTRSAAI